MGAALATAGVGREGKWADRLGAGGGGAGKLREFTMIDGQNLCYYYCFSLPKFDRSIYFHENPLLGATVYTQV